MIATPSLDRLRLFLHRPAQERGPSPLRIVPLCFALGLVATLFITLLLTLPRPWTAGVEIRHWGAAPMALARGVGDKSNDGISIADTDPTGIAIIALSPQPFSSQGYREVSWEVSDFDPAVSASLLWRNDFQPGVVHTMPLQIDSETRLRAWVGGQREWIGHIQGLALILRGKPARLLRVRGLTVSPGTAAEVLSRRFAEWHSSAVWKGYDINSLQDSSALPLPAVAAASAALALVFYLALAWWSRWQTSFLVCGAIIGLGWLLPDAAWQFRLLHQSRVSAERFAGLSLDERHRVSEDAPIYAVAATALAVLPPEPVRVFVTADDTLLRARLAYYLLPHHVFYQPSNGSLPSPASMKSGDYVVSLARRNVFYNPREQRLRWDDQAPVAATLLLTEGGNAIFRLQ